MEEFEIKFLEVDVPELEKKLLAIGAEKAGEFEYTRLILEDPELKMKGRHGWLRVRTDGKETTLTYKQSLKEKLGDGSLKNIGMKEVEVLVSDYEKTCKILEEIGLVIVTEEKNKRIRYVKGDVTFDIDFWPFIPPYLEIESISYEKARNAAEELGFSREEGQIGSAGSIYKKYGYNIDDYSSITFEGMIKK